MSPLKIELLLISLTISLSLCFQHSGSAGDSFITKNGFPSQNSTDVDNDLYGDQVERNTGTLNNGTTFGRIMLSYNDREINAFEGIPYVDQPNRFVKPGNVKTDYKNPLEALEIGSRCLQAMKVDTKEEYIPIGDEDCLFINVYTPVKTTASSNRRVFDNSRVPEEKGGDLLPVMVFIHGGQFVHGDAALYMPTRLLDKDVILVTFNYRLGALAFYSATPEMPGNLALYDQNAALKWVNKYIEDFGGDKSKVTLFGQDSGSISALYHLISGGSNDIINDEQITLFHAVIAQSGTALDPLAYDPDISKTAIEIATAVGCYKRDNEIDEKCMTDPNLVDKLALAAVTVAEIRNVHIPYFAPGKEKTLGMINMSPMDLIVANDYEKLPIMLGSCAQEGSFVFGEFYSYYLAPEDKVEDAIYLQTEMVSDVIALSGINDPLKFVESTLYDTYLKNVDRSTFSNVIPGMIDMTGALFNKAGILETAKLSYLNNADIGNTVGQKKPDIFLYSFDYKGENSTFPYHFSGVEDKPEFSDKEIGVTHGDDLFYLLIISSLNKKEDEGMMEKMTEMWANFATNYNPNSGGLEVDWLPYSNQNQEYLSIGEEIKAMEGYEDRYTLLVNEGEPNVDYSDIRSDKYLLFSKKATYAGDDSKNKDDEKNRISAFSDEIFRNSVGYASDDSNDVVDDTDTCSCIELDETKDKRTSYMAAMIIFILLFVITICIAIYYKVKS